MFFHIPVTFGCLHKFVSSFLWKLANGYGAFSLFGFLFVYFLYPYTFLIKEHFKGRRRIL